MKNISLIITAFLINACVPITNTSTSTQKKQVYSNHNYESNVGMVQVFPNNGSEQAVLDYPVISVNSDGLIVKFDLIQENYEYLNARYIHCNANWQPSNLTDIKFLNVYNEFNLNDYEYSANTKIPYVTYRSTLPAPIISGNYILSVYREGNEQDQIFVRRFCVFDNRAKIDSRLAQSSIVSKRMDNHQIEFSVNYQALGNTNPLQDFKTIILQNHNWNLGITDLKPTLMRQDQTYMEFSHFNGENNFPGINEFRFFDIRTIDYRGMNVSHIEKTQIPIVATLTQDKPRNELAYTQINDDLNGCFYLQNTDPTDSELQSEYVKVNFSLLSEPIDGKVYIAGKLTNWSLSPNSIMNYNPSSNSYEGSLMLRQGYYDYQYFVQSETLPIDALEGSNFQTKNDYEILLYYRNSINNYDELVGYRLFSSRN